MRAREMAAENIRGVITLNSISWKHKMAPTYKKNRLKVKNKGILLNLKKNFFCGDNC